MSRRKTISLTLDESVWRSTKIKAEAENRSLSNYIESLLKKESVKAEQ